MRRRGRGVVSQSALLSSLSGGFNADERSSSFSIPMETLVRLLFPRSESACGLLISGGAGAPKEWAIHFAVARLASG